MSPLVLDTSAVVGILGAEPAVDALIEAIDTHEECLVSAATLVEIGIVIKARYGAEGRGLVERFLRDAEAVVVAFDHHQADCALEGWRRFGKGRHRAALNLGDCFTYALAVDAGAPILAIGDEFRLTDAEVLALE